ncbi:MAG: endonuclease/exonuclease/phosphatase family protein [Candidatus Palauibacterales bacterium]|nr:endonuclease/exonuclease/phosphatase family protein [Candidatus Palauibacterales bacterium]MDP2482522.1 endonuclease/exonuclease/phosphatase family protein [Candidatus Palauibacterales bacterium]
MRSLRAGGLAGIIAAMLPIVLAACGPATGGHDVAAADTVRVLAYNIHHGEGMDSVVDLARIAKLIRDVRPDLVAVQEVDSVVERTGGVDQAAELGSLTKLNAAFGSFMPYQGGAYGMAILSRWPIARFENIRLPDGDEPRSALSGIVELPRTGARLRFVGIHLYRTEAERLGQARSLEEQLGSDSIPTLLAGDFNSEPGTAVMEHLSSAWRIVDKGEDSLTFPSYGPEREIDYVLLRPSRRFQVLSERVLDEPVASDHRPILVELAVTRR